MLIQETPPDTSAYMIAGYAVFALIMAIYLLSLFVRKRNLDRDLSTLEGIAAQARDPAEERFRGGQPARRPKATRPKRRRRKTLGRKITRRK